MKKILGENVITLEDSRLELEDDIVLTFWVKH